MQCILDNKITVLATTDQNYDLAMYLSKHSLAYLVVYDINQVATYVHGKTSHLF